jgi:hypothetical protein
MTQICGACGCVETENELCDDCEDAINYEMLPVNKQMEILKQTLALWSVDEK